MPNFISITFTYKILWKGGPFGPPLALERPKKPGINRVKDNKISQRVHFPITQIVLIKYFQCNFLSPFRHWLNAQYRNACVTYFKKTIKSFQSGNLEFCISHWIKNWVFTAPFSLWNLFIYLFRPGWHDVMHIQIVTDVVESRFSMFEQPLNCLIYLLLLLNKIFITLMLITGKISKKGLWTMTAAVPRYLNRSKYRVWKNWNMWHDFKQRLEKKNPILNGMVDLFDFSLEDF